MDLLENNKLSTRQLENFLHEYHVPEDHIIPVSAHTGHNIYTLKERIAAFAPAEDDKNHIVSDLIHPNDFVVLVVPIDKAAPKGRLITATAADNPGHSGHRCNRYRHQRF